MTTRSRVYRGTKAHSATYRSGLEAANAEHLKKHNHPVIYEQFYIPYIRPASNHTYTPDYILSNGIIVETKGIFDAADRQKHNLIQKQFPELDIRFVFSNSKSKIYKGSKTTYGAWCEKNGLMYADKLIPLEWLKESKSGRADPYTILKPKKTGGTL